MRLFIALFSLAVLAFAGCGLPIPGMGGGAGAWKPDSALSTQFAGDLSNAKEGQYVTYVSEASGNKSSVKTTVVGKLGDATLVEVWNDAGSMAYGYLFAVGADKKITKAWSAAKDDKEWTSIKVNEPPAPTEAPATDGPKPTIKESDEQKVVGAGTFEAHKYETTVNVQGTDYTSLTWFAKDAPTLGGGSDKGGLIAMEASGSKTWLDAKGDDGKPTIPLPAAE